MYNNTTISRVYKNSGVARGAGRARAPGARAPGQEGAPK